MSRYSGAQHRGAARELAGQRRREADYRQWMAAERDAQRRAELAAAPPVKPLTDAEVYELHYAAMKVELVRRLNQLGVPWPIAEKRGAT